MSQARDFVFKFLEKKGVDIDSLSGDSLLLEHMKSVDFMEMIVQIEMDSGITLDLADADIESIVVLSGLLKWLE